MSPIDRMRSCARRGIPDPVLTRSGPEMVRVVLRMVGCLHARGFESLYLDSTMSPSGLYWRYEIGPMEDGYWPARQSGSETVVGSIGGDPPPELTWGDPADSETLLADKFLATYPRIGAAARRPNPSYASWFREMETRTAPNGIPVFGYDDGPDHEHCLLWDGPSDFSMPMPPGYRLGT